MNTYLILIREDVSRMSKLSEAEFQHELEQFTRWVEEMSATGNYISGDPLETGGRYLKKDSIVSDGPFIESKEAISGYLIIQAKDMDAAVKLAQKCPIFQYEGAVELRQIMKM